MPAASFNFKIEQGTTFSKVFTINDAQGDGVDLTGSTLRGQLRETPTSSSAVASFSFSLSNQTTNPGQFTMSLTATQTAAIPAAIQNSAKRKDKDYAYDVERVLGDGSVERILQGVVSLSPEVTR